MQKNIPASASCNGGYKDIIACHRPYSRKVGMDRLKRAKQFAPFAALKGFEENIRAREEIYVPMLILSEDYQQELDRKLRLIQHHDRIRLTYFSKKSGADNLLGQYKTVTGTVEDIDHLHHLIRVGETDIPLCDISDVKRL